VKLLFQNGKFLSLAPRVQAAIN